MKYTAEFIELKCWSYYDRECDLIVPNVSYGLLDHEADLIMMSKAGYLSEIEIKISAGDLKADVLKRHGHRSNLVKNLYFAIPEKLRKYEVFIPERAGIITVPENENNAITIHRPPVPNKDVKPLTIENRYRLARLGAMRVRGLKIALARYAEWYAEAKVDAL